MEARYYRLVEDAEEEEPRWQELSRDRVARVAPTLLSFVVVAVLAFVAGARYGGEGPESPAHPLTARVTASSEPHTSCASLPSTAWKQQLCPRVYASPTTESFKPSRLVSQSCASLPNAAWKAQLCPSLYASVARVKHRQRHPRFASSSCASLPDPAWKLQLCPSLYPGDSAWKQ